MNKNFVLILVFSIIGQVFLHTVAVKFNYITAVKVFVPLVILLAIFYLPLKSSFLLVALFSFFVDITNNSFFGVSLISGIVCFYLLIVWLKFFRMSVKSYFFLLVFCFSAVFNLVNQIVVVVVYHSGFSLGFWDYIKVVGVDAIIISGLFKFLSLFISSDNKKVAEEYF